MANCINWLASYPKSGNTWVRVFLEYYEHGKLDINNMNVVLGDERFYYYQAVSAQPYHTFDLYQWAMIRPAALNMYLEMNRGRKQVIVKTHNAHAVIGAIPIFPPLISGPSVYLVRNPLDIVPSFAAHTGKTIDDMITHMKDTNHAFKANAETQKMIGFLSSWDNHVKAWSGIPDILVVRYEDLQANPTYWFSEILKQFGYEVNKSKVLESIEATTLTKLQEQELSQGFIEKGKNDKFFGSKKQKLSSEQIDQVIADYKPVMQELGYLNEEVRYGCNYSN